MNKLKIFLVAIAAIAFSSCDKWMDINTDPNYPSEIPTAMPITSGMGSSENVFRISKQPKITRNIQA